MAKDQWPDVDSRRFHVKAEARSLVLDNKAVRAILLEVTSLRRRRRRRRHQRAPARGNV